MFNVERSAAEHTIMYRMFGTYSRFCRTLFTGALLIGGYFTVSSKICICIKEIILFVL